MLYIPFSLKRCTKCHSYSPATRQYFHKDNEKSDRLSIACKICRRKQRINYRRHNPDKERAYAQSHRIDRNRTARMRYWTNYEKERTRRHNAYQNHRDYYVRWRLAHPESVRRADKRYKKAHKEQLKQQDKVRRQMNKLRNPEKYRLLTRMSSRRRKAVKRTLPTTFTVKNWLRSMEYFRGVCAYCSRSVSLFDLNYVLHQDHFIPQSKGGGYTPDNIIPACQTCNLSKGNRDPHEWLIDHFGPRRAKAIRARIQDYFKWVKSQN